MLRRWMHAMSSGDVAALAELMADDLIHVDPAGVARTREEILAGLHAAGPLPTMNVTVGDVSIRLFDSVAVVTGLTIMSARTDARRIVGRFRFTDVFVDRHGQWKAVAAHTTAIAEPPR